MNFTDKIIALEDEARKFILSKVKDGEKLELISKEELDNVEDDEILWDLPNVEFNNKYNELVTYAIIAINREDESLDLYGYALGEYLGDTYIFTPYQLTANQLCFLADYLK